MSAPLPLSYNWRTPVLVSSVVMLVCVSLLVRGRTDGWWGVVLALVLSWAGYLSTVWLRSRAFLCVEGPAIRVRRYRDFHRVEGAELRAVSQFLTAQGPSYRLSVRTETGGLRKITAPTALLKAGHSTLFAWILTWAPEAELDKASRRTVAELQQHGLIAGDGGRP